MLAFTNPVKGKYTKEKKIHKEFLVDSKATLQIQNSYGNVDIVTWDQNKTVIEVHISTQGNDEEAVTEKLNNITVAFSGTNTMVSAITKIEKNTSKWSSWWKSSENEVIMEINYTIKLPVTNNVLLDNDYGAISINTLKGNATINCDYGQLIIGDLLGEENILHFDYTNKSSIQFMKNGKIMADYSSFTLDNVISLTLEADYTTSEIGEVSYLNYSCDYGKILVDKAIEVKGKGAYVTNKFQSISSSFDVNSDYSSIYIGTLKPTVKTVRINSEFTGVKVGMHPETSFDFTINIDYASLNAEHIVTLTKNDKEGTHKNYKGYVGKQNSGNSIFISSKYGGVTLFKN